MDIISYINYSSTNLLNFNQAQFKKYIISNNGSNISELLGDLDNGKKTCNKYLIYRIFDILNKILIIIKNEDNKIINRHDISGINLIIDDFMNFYFKIEDFNIEYEDKKLIVINFNFVNFIKYKNKNIGGLPLFLFDFNQVILKINFNKKFNFDYNESINVYIGGIMIVLEYVNNIQCEKFYEKFKSVPKLLLNEKKEIIKNLTFNNPNEKTDFENKKYLDKKLLNYLNLVLYKKSFFNDKIIYDLELEEETTYIVFKIKYFLIRFVIRLYECDIFDADIFTLYSNGYFVYKLNSKITSDSKIKLIVYNNDNLSIQEIDNKLEIEIYNVYDIDI